MAKSAKKWAIGAAVAGVVGYVAGILTAPKSGKETRQDIKSTAAKVKRETEKKLKTAHSDLNRVIEEVKDKGGKLKGKAQTEFSQGLDKAKKAKEKVREVLSALHEGDADDPELKQALKEAKDALSHLQRYIKKAK
jgi:gas vesicle protein